MMKKSTIYWLSGIVLLGGMVAYFFVDGIKTAKKAGAQSPADPAMAGVQQDGLASILSSSFPLKQGSYGAEVKKLQQFINSRGYYLPDAPLDDDSDFGKLTKAAVIKMQGKLGLQGDTLGQVSYDYFMRNVK